MARRKKTLIQSLVTSGAILLAEGFGRLPLGVSRRLARALARVAYYLVPRIRRVGLANLNTAFGDSLTLREKKRILRESVENVALVAAEFVRIRALHGAFIERHVRVTGIEHLPRDRGIILIGAHLGNWEWMASILTEQGFHTSVIMRPLDDPRLDAFVDRIRIAQGVRTVPKDSAARETIGLLRAGWLVGMLVDQNPRENAAPVQVFGQPAWGTIAPALIAARAQAPVHAAVMVRQPGGDYLLEFTPEIPMVRTADSLDDLLINGQRCQDALEAFIRRAPGQWLWFHRRWRARPRLEQEWAERLAQRDRDAVSGSR